MLSLRFQATLKCLIRHVVWWRR